MSNFNLIAFIILFSVVSVLMILIADHYWTEQSDHDLVETLQELKQTYGR